MKKILCFVGLLLNFANYSWSSDSAIPANELRTLTGFLVQDIALVLPRIPQYKQVFPDVMILQDATFEILIEENLHGNMAYQFLLAILTSDSKTAGRFSSRILNLLPNLGLSEIQKLAVLQVMDGGPYEGSVSQPISVRQAPPVDIFNQVIQYVGGLPSVFPDKGRLLAGIKLVGKIILGVDDDCYGNNPDCVWGANEGILKYTGEQLATDQQFLVDNIRFYTRLAKYQSAHPHPGDFTMFDAIQAPDLWPLALGAVENDPLRAARVITSYTNDQCCNGIYVSGPIGHFVDLLNNLAPGPYHGDYPESILHAPGALGGINVPVAIRNRFLELRARHLRLQNEEPTYRLGNYHLYGGLLTGTEILRHGFGVVDGVKFSTFISEALGYYYKKFTLSLWLSEDAAYLWGSQMKEDENQRPQKPADWDAQRFDLAVLSLDENLAYLEYTHWQHRAGAEFAYQLFTSK